MPTGLNLFTLKNIVWNFFKKLIGADLDKTAGESRPSTPPSPQRRNLGQEPPSKIVTGPAASLTDAEFVDKILAETFNTFQEQAVAADQARKAKFRAHVERAVPPITDGGRTALDRARDTMLAIRHIFPPRLPQRGLSFLGGHPVVPDDFDWPMIHNRSGSLERLTFMAQIDCSDIPPGATRDLLPAKGFLYFFAPMSLNFGEDACHFVVRYLPGPARKTWEPSTFAGAGKIADRSDELTALLGTNSAYGRVDIDFGWLEEPSDADVEARLAEGLPHVVAQKIRAERAEAFLGPKREGNRRLQLSEGGDAAWLLDLDFPTNRAMARILRDRVSAYSSGQRKILDAQSVALGNIADDDPAMLAISERKQALNALDYRNSKAFAGTNYNPKDNVPGLAEDEKARARAFYSELLETGLVWAEATDRPAWHDKALINGWMAQAAYSGAMASLLAEPGPDVAPIPAEIIEALALRHDARQHHLFGEGVLVQVAADEMKDRYILLLQLGRDPEMDWLVGEMGPLQYWIAPEDLAARRFENTVLTIEAY